MNKKDVRKRKKRIIKQRSIRSVSYIGIAVMIAISLCVLNVFYTMATGYHLRSGENILAYKSGSGRVTSTIIANRGNIYDHNKEIIAQDIESYNLYAVIYKNRVNETKEKAYVDDFQKASEQLAPILNCEASDLMTFFESAEKSGSYQTEFGTYGKDLSAEQKSQIEALNIGGLGFEKSTTRVYPTGTFASQLIGYADYNYEKKRISGEMGIESYYDEELSGENGEVIYQTDNNGYPLPSTKQYTKNAVNGDDVYLTIDKNVQVTLEKALSDTMESNNAEKAWGIVMEADTGKILAQAGYPTFDLNTRETIADNYYNLPSEWAYECGSVMKSFIYAAAMEEGVYNGSATFDSGSAEVGYDDNGNLVRAVDVGYGKTIASFNDALGHDFGTISFDEGLIRSANTGIVSLLTRYLSTDKEYEYLNKFGFGQKVGIVGVSESNSTTLADSNPLDRIMTGFGQSSTVTSYQLIKAYSAIFGDGTMVTPYVVDKVVDPNTGEVIYQGKTKRSKKVISEATAEKMRALLTQVVTSEVGTARNYAMSDITLMAKTGTGQIVIDGKYSSSIYTSSIMAAAPAEHPEIIVYYAFQSSNILYYNTAYFQDVVREALVAVEQYNASSSQTSNSSETNSENLSSYEEYIMPSLINHSLDYVNSKLNGYSVNKVIIGDGTSVISQYPNASSSILRNENIFLLTDGTNITMPDLSGWSRKDINAFVKMYGFIFMFFF